MDDFRCFKQPFNARTPISHKFPIPRDELNSTLRTSGLFLNSKNTFYIMGSCGENHT